MDDDDDEWRNKSLKSVRVGDTNGDHSHALMDRQYWGRIYPTRYYGGEPSGNRSSQNPLLQIICCATSASCSSWSYFFKIQTVSQPTNGPIMFRPELVNIVIYLKTNIRSFPWTWKNNIVIWLIKMLRHVTRENPQPNRMIKVKQTLLNWNLLSKRTNSAIRQISTEQNPISSSSNFDVVLAQSTLKSVWCCVPL